MSVVEKPWGRLIIDDQTGETIGMVVKRRREFVEDDDFSFDPGSLTGSWFHVVYQGEIVWQGVIVGEPQAGKYLCSIDVLEPGAARVQRVFSLDTIMGLDDEAKRLLDGAFADARASVMDPVLEWRLYDSEEFAQEAFRAWASVSASLDKQT